ncbi:MAG: N-acetylmannosamine-6-phosphate 2-epimerase [Firmicutes bacterium]|nr:N-acetylmannosamine-6-phosphate 2-epimerase [Bacillota bacterium]
MNVLSRIEQGLIVSCQALEDEPLHGPILMAGMAWAAFQGGASGLRINGVHDIEVAKRITGLPIIGIIKRRLQSGEIIITPTPDDAKAVIAAGADIVAVDATQAKERPIPSAELISKIKEEVGCVIMADVGSLEDGVAAARAGADIVASTFGGARGAFEDRGMDWELLDSLIQKTGKPVIAEGGIWTPLEARKALDLGAHAVVVGSAITRPHVITRRFVKHMKATKSSVACRNTE